MELRRLGNSGLKVSKIGLGGNTFGATVHGDDAVRVIRRALDLGINFIDTADSYSGGRSEELVGQAVAGNRGELVIGTKVGWASKLNFAGPLSRAWIVRAAEASLKRLGTDYIDLYQLHKPDPETPIEETVRAMEDLVTQGKVRYLGVSNFAAWQLVQTLSLSEGKKIGQWISVQPRWNLLEGLEDPQLLPACRALGIGIIPYTPLASGILTGKYRRGEEPQPGTRAGDLPMVKKRVTDAKLAAVERLKPWAEGLGHSTADLGIAWLLSFPEVSTVIVGARTPEQVETNVQAAAWSLGPDERAEAERLARGIDQT